MPRVLLHLLLFAGAFAATARGLAELAPERMKVAWLERQKDEVDAIFVGSSRVYREIDPARFDAACAAAGRPLRSLNLGMQGMRFPETLDLAERILTMEPARLRYLFLELAPFETAIEPENRLTERVVSWHSWPVSWRLILASLAEDLPWSERLDRAADHLLHWAHRAGNLGRGFAILETLSGTAAEDFEGRHTLGPAGDGFRALDDEQGGNFRERRRLFLEDLEGFRAAQEVLLAPDGPEPADPLLAPVLARLAAACAARGVRPIYLILPVIEKQTALRRLHDAGFAPDLIAFDDPAAWPDFYRVRYRYDIHHLNAEGAALLTGALAAATLRLAEDGR